MIKSIVYNNKIYKVIDPGSLKKSGSKYLDQLGDLGELGRRNPDIKEVLWSKYQITPEDYYRIVVDEGDTSLHKCPICNKPLGFINLISGFGGPKRTCGYSCGAKLRIKDRGLGEWSPEVYDTYPNYSELTTELVQGYLVHSPRCIVRVGFRSKRFVDQLSDDGRIYLSRRRFQSALEKLYGLTEMQYYSLITYGDKDFRPNCSCGTPVEFAGAHIGFRKFCSDKCRTKWRIEFDKIKFIRFCKQNNITVARMYCGVLKFDSSILKVGITTKHITERAHIAKIRSPHLLVEGSPEYIADLEYELKMKFQDKLIRKGKNHRESYSSELLSDIIKYLKSIK